MRRGYRCGVISVLALILPAAACAGSALAARGHVLEKSFGHPGAGPGEFAEPSGVAVDESTQDVYVADKGNDRVEAFDAAGNFLFEFNGSGTLANEEGIKAGSGPGEVETGRFERPEGVAVDNDPASPSHGDVYVDDAGHNLVDKYSPQGRYLGQISGTCAAPGVCPGEVVPFGELRGVGVDAAGMVWVYASEAVADFTGGEVNEFIESRQLVVPAGFAEPGVFAVDRKDDLFAVAFTEGRQGVGEFTDTGALTTASIGEETSSEAPSAGVGVELPTDDVYMDRFGFVVRLTPTGSVVEDLSAPGMQGTGVGVDSEAETVYVADAAGEVHVFAAEPPAAPVIVSDGVSAVTSSSALLEAEVKPRSEPAEANATFRFEWGPCTASTTCSSSGYPFSTSLGTLSPGFDIEPVSAILQGLGAGTPYHFRVVAENSHDVGTPVPGEERTFTTQVIGSFQLPDGRQWELVSPPDKHGASIEPIGEGHVTQAAAEGGGVTYATTAPTESEPHGYSNLAQIVSTRDSSGGWTSHDVSPPHVAPTGPAFQGEYGLFSPDLSLAVVQPFGVFISCTPSEGVAQPCLSPEASEQTAFRYSTSGGVYLPLVTAGNDTANPFEPFGKQDTTNEDNCPFGANSLKICGPRFAGSSPDLRHIVVSSAVALTGVPVPAGEEELYEWNEGAPPPQQLKLVSVAAPETPGEAEKGAANAPELGFRNRLARNAVSTDGSRIIWTETNGAEHLYLRDVARGETLQLDAVQGGSEVPGNQQEAEFQFASSDGSRVFFTDRQPLTADSGADPVNAKADLYECEVVVQGGSLKCLLSDITPLAAGGEHAEVQGHVLGASEQGCDVGSSAECNVYFVANAALMQGEGAVHGDCVGAGVKAPVNASCNLYVAHFDGSGWHTRLVTVLSNEDSPDWVARGNENLIEEMTSRVSPDGHWLAFMSQRGLTGYDTRDTGSGRPDEEVYLYRAQAGTQAAGLACASCDPTGARPAGELFGHMTLGGEGGFETWSAARGIAGDVPTWTSFADLGVARYQPRYLSDAGRLFFDSSDALVSRDVNGTGDVYEYEPQGGGPEGAPCEPASTNGSDVFKQAHSFSVEGVGGEEPAGCVALISSGRSPQESLFLDASESGGDVFFMTSAPLVSQDFDTSYDVYDAHECTTASPCPQAVAEQPPPCTTADSCRAAPIPQPTIFGVGPTETLVSTGNLSPLPPPVKAAKSLTRAEKLANALKACRRKAKRAQRIRCESQARSKYGVHKKATVQHKGRG